MKKYILLGLCILGIFLFLSPPKEENELRIRVIANSNSSEDQEIKYLVASSLVKILNNLKEENIDIKNEIYQNIPKIKNKLQGYLQEKDYEHIVLNVYLGKEKFPTKSYNNEVIPGGTYDTLVVKINDAKGSNWWSLLYPEFFNCSYEEINSGEVVYRSYILDKLKRKKNIN